MILLVSAPPASFSAAPEAAAKTRRILILGDSLTEGLGVEKEKAFPDLLEKLLHDSGYPNIQVINAGISGSTTASGLSRLKWHLKSKPELVVVALGANDGLRGFKIQETRKNLLEILALARKNGLKILLAGMLLPPNYGPEYRKQFEKLFQDISKSEKVPLLPFILEGVGGDPELNLPDGIHPNEKGHARVAQTVLKYIKPLL
jgi:acyl-CoA thioesterase I